MQVLSVNDEEFRKSYICEKSKFFKKKYDLPKEELSRTVANYSNNISRIKEIRRPLVDQLIYVAMEFIEFEQLAEKCDVSTKYISALELR